MSKERDGQVVLFPHRVNDRQNWAIVECRGCGVKFECIDGRTASRDRLCLWCWTDLTEGKFDG
jgi:hypothetical protein